MTISEGLSTGTLPEERFCEIQLLEKIMGSKTIRFILLVKYSGISDYDDDDTAAAALSLHDFKLDLR